MSTVAPESPPSSPGLIISLENLLFDYPGADVILRSCDSYEFRVLKMYIFHSSPALGEQVLAVDIPQSATSIPSDAAAAASLPVVQLSDSGAVLFSLLTYIFPVQPILPSTVEQVMELLSAAQKYKMDAVLTHIRNHIARQHPPFIHEDNSLYIYSLAQKHGLRQEVLQAARSTLVGLPNLAIDSLGEKLEMMPGAFLHELWKYHQRVRENLTSDLDDFIASGAHKTFKGSCRTVQTQNFSRWFFRDSQSCASVPSWLNHYILSIGRSPSLFDLSIFYMALTSHIQSLSNKKGGCSACATTSSKSILKFWAALSAIYNDSITKAESDLLLVEEGTNAEGNTISPGGCSSQLQYTDMLDADVVLQSSDLVSFRARKSILVTSSPFFADLFSLPQPPDHEVVDGLPVVHLPENAEALNSLITMLYPVSSKIPDSDDKILTLLAACQKYDMTTVQSSIRAEVSRRGLLSPTGAESFRLFANACKKRLIPEMKAAARLTLGHPMTFEYLGEALASFEGWALFDLSRFHRCCRLGVTSCFDGFLDGCSGPSNVWVGCPISSHPTPGPSTDHSTPPSAHSTPISGPPAPPPPGEHDSRDLPIWFRRTFTAKYCQLDSFTYPLVTPSSFREEYLEALRGHVTEKDCSFCMRTHTLKGEEFWTEIENRLAQALDVQYSFRIELPGSEATSPPSIGQAAAATTD